MYLEYYSSVKHIQVYKNIKAGRIKIIYVLGSCFYIPAIVLMFVKIY